MCTQGTLDRVQPWSCRWSSGARTSAEVIAQGPSLADKVCSQHVDFTLEEIARAIVDAIGDLIPAASAHGG